MKSRTTIIAILTVALAGIILWSGCGKMEGDPVGNQPPNVRFVNIPVSGDTFNYAPIVYWIGDDPDGFVEYYSYIDDTTAESRNDPSGFIQNVDPSRWVDTVATEATIYLLTEEGDTTEHTFFIRAIDDDGAVSVFDPSQHIRTYYRTNMAPYTPEIKWEVWPDDSFNTDEDDYQEIKLVPDTLYCIDSTTTNWGGIGFIWRCRDPDDRELNIIPLEFTYYLVAENGDTVWDWVSEEWSDTKNLTVYDLATGWYTLYVWSRDDGFTTCHEPAQITFYVIEPEFDRHILMYDETTDGGVGNWDGQAINQFYYDLLESIPPEHLVPEAHYVLDDVDVMFFDNSNDGNPLPYNLMHHYKLILMYDEDGFQSAPPEEAKDYREKVFSDYMDIGGNVWIVGRKLLAQTFGSQSGPHSQSQMPEVLVNYFGLSGGVGASWPPLDAIEFAGAIPALPELPELAVDTTLALPSPYPPTPAIPEVDVISRRVSSTPSFYNFTFTTYYYNSIYTSTQDTVTGENSTVMVNVSGYPNPSATECFVLTDNAGLMEVFSVYNVTKDVEGEVVYWLDQVIRVSYPVGDPWEQSDVLEVDYRFNPYSASEFHLQPCGVFKIAMDNDFNFLYRSAINTFPLYPLDNSNNAVRDMFSMMLNTFFSPYL